MRLPLSVQDSGDDPGLCSHARFFSEVDASLDSGVPQGARAPEMMLPDSDINVMRKGFLSCHKRGRLRNAHPAGDLLEDGHRQLVVNPDIGRFDHRHVHGPGLLSGREIRAEGGLLRDDIRQVAFG